MRRLSTVTVIVALLGAAFTGAVVDHVTQPRGQAAYDDGWHRGQDNLAFFLGHRLPTADEDREFIACRAAGHAGCHLTWDTATATYAASGR